MENHTLGELISAYIKLRDKADALKKVHKEALAPYNEAMGKLELHFQKAMNANGLESLKTDVGTAYQSTQNSVTMADWDVFYKYVMDNDATYMLEKRASKTAVLEVLGETGELPPGLNLSRNIKVNVRRS